MKKIILLVLITIIFISGCIEQQVDEQQDVIENVNVSDSDNEEVQEITLDSFTGNQCDYTIYIFDPENIGVQETQWVGSTLKVKANIAINCTSDMLGGDVELQEGCMLKDLSVCHSIIILKYESSVCDPCTACRCAHEVEYVISGLEEKDYDFQFEEL